MINREESFEQGTDRWIQEVQKEHHRDYKVGEYHVSDLVGFGRMMDSWCPRYVFYKYKSPETITREKAGIFERGRTYELKLGEAILPKIGWEILEKQEGDKENTRVEFKVNDEIKLIGHYDFIAMHEGKKYVVEAKSINFRNYDTFKRFCIEPDFPKGEHVLQANFYAKMLNLPYAIVYTSIGDMGVRGWAADPEQEAFDVVVKRAESIHDTLKGVGIPDGRSHWKCDFSQKRNPRVYCEAYNWCRQLGNYGIHPAVYGFCKACNLKIQESNIHGQGNLLVDEDGRMLCPRCHGRASRRTLTSKVSAGFDSERIIDYSPLVGKGEGYAEKT